MLILLPKVESADWRTHLDRVVKSETLLPFSPVSVGFVAAVSRRLFSDPNTAGIPEFAALGHWMRKAHILELEQIFAKLPDPGARLARGFVVHFAPGNVDSLFVYSWLLSLLVGNTNVIRLSSTRNEQSERLLEALGHVLAAPEFGKISERNLVVSYEHDDELTAELCRDCHMRVIWGGDTSVKALRKIDINPLATEIAFPDRFAFAVLDADAVLNAAQKDFERLVHGFFADAFWFHQLACSSPRLVVWIGGAPRIEAAKQRFWSALDAECSSKGVTYPAAIGIRRMTALYAYAAGAQVDQVSEVPTALNARGHLAASASDFRDAHCGGGFFLERELDSWNDVPAIADQKDQTMTYYGFSQEQLRGLSARLPVRAIDRIVPVGQALQFSHVWDGINLLEAFSREIVIQFE